MGRLTWQGVELGPVPQSLLEAWLGEERQAEVDSDAEEGVWPPSWVELASAQAKFWG